VTAALRAVWLRNLMSEEELRRSIMEFSVEIFGNFSIIEYPPAATP